MKKFLIASLSGLLIFPISYSGAEYSSEMQEAYNWAYKNGITTMNSIERANMNGSLTRAELAKMISNYTIEILGKEIDTTKNCNFNDVSEELDAKYYYGITHACQLGLMGQGIDKFRPNDGVTRAEFGTILSRALRGNKNEGGITYYQNHLKALKSEGIMTNISYPMNKEIRGYVMIMLMRSYEPDYIQSYNDEDYTEYDDISYVMKMLD